MTVEETDHGTPGACLFTSLVANFKHILRHDIGSFGRRLSKSAEQACNQISDAKRMRAALICNHIEQNPYKVLPCLGNMSFIEAIKAQKQRMEEMRGTCDAHERNIQQLQVRPPPPPLSPISATHAVA